MKRLIFVFIITALLCYNLSVFAALTVEDLGKIQKIINDSEVRMEKRLLEVEKRIIERITELDKRLSGDIQELDKRLSGDIQNLDKRLSGDIQNLDKRLSFHSSLIVALIIAIIGFVSVPMGFITFQYFKMRAQQEEEIKTLREKIEALETQLLVENQD
ncbi:hypothetical protein C6501_08930 [Candidatus Poribacteria bacterium]|nr:MAG: hypothetical protein C6501_08930 [Candidatus Poribacteria bacterium]